MADVTETDYTTNPPTITERDFTPEEKAQRIQDEAAAVAAKKIADEAVLKREAAVAKLVALGLTVDDLIALGL